MSKYLPERISELPITFSVNKEDLFLIVDSSDLDESENGTTKQSTIETLEEYILSKFRLGSINGHSDVSISDRRNGQLLRFNSESSRWENWTAEYVETETDPVFVKSAAFDIVSNDIDSWNEAHGWGDHSIVGYLTELPVHALTDHSDMDLRDISDGELLRYNSVSKKWENWTPDFVTSEQVDPTGVLRHIDFTSLGLMKRGMDPGTYTIIQDRSKEWNTAYEWGNHANVGYLTDITNQGLGALSNVSLTSTTLQNQFLRFNGSHWVNHTVIINDIDDVNLGIVSDNQILRYNTSTNKWINHTLNINDVNDVSLSGTLTNNEVLKYDGTSWINGTLELNNLNNVTLGTLANDQVLKYDSSASKWVNGTLALNNASDVSLSGSLETNDILKYNGVAWINSTLELNNLNNVTLGTLVGDQVLKYDSSASKWVNGTLALNNASDVNLSSSLTPNEVLKYNGTAWINGTLELGDLSNVILASPSPGQLLTYTESGWINSTYEVDISGESIGDLSDVSIGTTGSPGELQEGHLLRFNGSNWENFEPSYVEENSVSGSFTTNDGQTITVTNGIITQIILTP